MIRTYQPAGPVLNQFHKSDAFGRILLGPVGSGKSSASFCELLRRAHEQKPGPDGKRRSRWGIIRNSYPELISTTIKTAHFWLPRTVGRYRETPPLSHHVVTGDLDIEFMYLAIDRPEDVNKLLSLELTGAWLNEARELSKASLDMVTSRIGRYPAKSDGGPSWFGVILDSNMPDSDHWLHRIAEEDTPDNFDVFKQPGGVIRDGQKWVVNPDAENIANLPEGYYLNQLSAKSEPWIRCYLGAEYMFLSQDRAVFPEFVDTVHTASESLEPLENVPLHIGVDFGLTPAAILLQQTGSGQWQAIEELCMTDAGIVRFAEALNGLLDRKFPDTGYEHIFGFGDPAGAARSQVDERSAMAVLTQQTGIRFRPASTNSFNLRREAVARVLTRMVEGQPGFVVSPSCRMLRKALAGKYYYRRVQVGGDERYADSPTKNEYSHVADALQYCLLGGGEGRKLRGRGERTTARAPRTDSKYSPLNYGMGR